MKTWPMSYTERMKTMPKTPTPQQLKVVEVMTQGEGHYVVDARAGTGKTTTGANGAWAATEAQGPLYEIGATAFNVTITRALQTKMPDNVVCKGLNSVGYGALRKVIGDRLPKGNASINTKKLFDLQRQMGIPRTNFPDLPRGVALARAWGLVPKDSLASPEGLMDDTPDVWRRLINTYNLDCGIEQDPTSAIRDAVKLSIKMAWQGDVDFDDQLYLPVIYNWNLPKYDMLILDEAQDVTPVQRELCKRMLNSEGRLMAFGDVHQAIYGFRGADRSAIPNIVADLGAEIIPLTVSFRCPKAVVTEAQQFVPDIEHFEGAIEGEIRHNSDGGEEFRQHLDNRESMAILCRNNAPLASLCFKLIAAGLPASIQGRDIGAALEKMVKSAKSSRVAAICRELQEKTDREQRLLEEKGLERNNTKDDRMACLWALGSNVGTDASQMDLIYAINSIFTKDSSPITMSTVHKCKGLEWNHVYILDPELMPSKWAKTEDAIQQEINLQYVAVTRAQRTLTYISSQDF